MNTALSASSMKESTHDHSQDSCVLPWIPALWIKQERALPLKYSALLSPLMDKRRESSKMALPSHSQDPSEGVADQDSCCPLFTIFLLEEQ